MNFWAPDLMPIWVEMISFAVVLIAPLAGFSVIYQKWVNHQQYLENRQARRERYHTR